MKTSTKIWIGVGVVALIGAVIFIRNQMNKNQNINSSSSSNTANAPKSFTTLKENLKSRTSGLSATSSQPVNPSQFQTVSR